MKIGSSRNYELLNDLEMLFITSGNAVQQQFSHAMIEEVTEAQARATIRVAQKFPHLLSERQAIALRSFWGESGE